MAQILAYYNETFDPDQGDLSTTVRDQLKERKDRWIDGWLRRIERWLNG